MTGGLIGPHPGPLPRERALDKTVRNSEPYLPGLVGGLKAIVCFVPRATKPFCLFERTSRFRMAPSPFFRVWAMSESGRDRISGCAIEYQSLALRRRAEMAHRGSGRDHSRRAGWLLGDELRSLSLLHDDFAYIAQSRNWAVMCAHLFEPHNAHVVPVFRIWTLALVNLAGRLANLPAVFAAAGYLGLVAAMLALGRVITRETGQLAAGLAAMAILGISTVTHPAVIWFSAGQALWAGTAILVGIALAQSWSEKGGALRLAAVALTTLAAPAIWSGGLLAGPAAVIYLYVENRRRAHGAMVFLAGVTLCAGVLMFIASRGQIDVSQLVWEKRPDVWPRPIQVLLHTSQVLVEECVCGNLGLQVTTTPRQAVALLFAFAVLHTWSSRGRAGWNALEVSGAFIAIGGCLLVFFFRGNLPYSSLRAYGWYHAIPQLGAILFGAGWWTAVSAALPERMSLGQAAAVLVFTFLFFLIQMPRAAQQLIQSAPELAVRETGLFPSTELLAGRARYFKVELHERQLRALVRLDRLDRLLTELNASPELLRGAFGRVMLPGLSEQQLGCDAISLLVPRPRNPDARAALAAESLVLIELLRPEPEPVPPWLDGKAR